MESKKEKIQEPDLRKIHIALASMGYRKLNKSYAKPFGFTLLQAEVMENQVKFSCFTKGGGDEILHWSTKSWDFDREYTFEDLAYLIAQVETDLCVANANDCGEISGKVFNFTTPIDSFHLGL